MSLSFTPAVPSRKGSFCTDEATSSFCVLHRRTASYDGLACWIRASAAEMSSTDVSLVVSGSICWVLMATARAALSRRARSAAWFAAGTVSTSATSATMASGHQILALTSSSVNLSNTETRSPPMARTSHTIPLRPADANSRTATAKDLRRRGRRDHQERLLGNEPRVAVNVVRQLRTSALDRSERGDEATDLRGRLRLAVQIEPDPRRRLDGRGDTVAQQGRCREQDPVDLVALGPPLPPSEPGLDAADRPPIGLLRAALLIEERRELLVELRAESFLIWGGGVQHDGRPAERLAGSEPGPRQDLRHASRRAERLAGSGRGASQRGGRDVAKRQSLRADRHPARAAEIPAGQPRDEPRPHTIDALALELLDHE